MIGLSPSRPGYFQPQPDVLVPEQILPAASCARNTVVSRPTSGSIAWRHSAASGVSGQARFCSSGTSLSNHACQARRESSIRLSAGSAPISRAKRAAPSPTRNSCGSRRMISRATLTGCR